MKLPPVYLTRLLGKNFDYKILLIKPAAAVFDADGDGIDSSRLLEIGDEEVATPDACDRLVSYVAVEPSRFSEQTRQNQTTLVVDSDAVNDVCAASAKTQRMNEVASGVQDPKKPISDSAAFNRGGPLSSADEMEFPDPRIKIHRVCEISRGIDVSKLVYRKFRT